ncbi:hypothetical protein L3V86_03645 [Thiotrichales bacterium 19S11-10]|nr:hypothetical protein [Thiotrichales bacterium 19S11-10]
MPGVNKKDLYAVQKMDIPPAYKLEYMKRILDHESLASINDEIYALQQSLPDNQDQYSESMKSIKNKKLQIEGIEYHKEGGEDNAEEVVEGNENKLKNQFIHTKNDIRNDALEQNQRAMMAASEIEKQQQLQQQLEPKNNLSNPKNLMLNSVLGLVPEVNAALEKKNENEMEMKWG